MNRGVSQVQKMMGERPSWGSLNNMKATHPDQQTSPLLPSLSATSSSSSSSVFCQFPQPPTIQSMTSLLDNHDQPESWSQLLLGGLVEEEDRCSFTHFHSKKIENWEDLVLYPSGGANMIDIKQEITEKGYMYGQRNEEIQAPRSSWSQILPNSSRSCVTTSFNSSMLDFSNNKTEGRHHQAGDRSSLECNSTSTGSPFKKARVQASAQSTFKVRKEKLGDRITALHQIVSPFGKTDTASVLLEAIGYIRFLQSQIEVLSSPYLATGSGGNMKQSAQGERSCIFPEDPGQLLNDNCTMRRGSQDQDAVDGPKKDLRSRGLCLVPVSFTMHVGNENGSDYWAPTFGGGFR